MKVQAGHRVFLGLGSNLGDRVGNLSRAVTLLMENPYFVVTRVSDLFETAPVGYVDQPWFVNAVVEARTSLTARKVLELCLDTEKKMGRVRRIKWGPRNIDIDLLLYDADIIAEDGLEVPHPRMTERLFVLVPLAQLYSEWSWEGKTIGQMIDDLARVDGQSLRRLELERPWVRL